MKHKKVLLIALICLIGIGISSIFLFSGHRPFKDLEATDITSANVRLSPPHIIKCFLLKIQGFSTFISQ